MKEVDIYGLVIITLFLSMLLTFLGWVMKSQNAGDMINGYDPKKYDKDKISNLIGKDMMYSGILILTVGLIGYFLGIKYYNYATLSQCGILVICVIKMIYDLEKKCRWKKRS